MGRPVFKNDEFMDLALESVQHQGLGTHSFRKGAADEARKLGAQVDEIEIRGWWKSQGRRVVFRHIDVSQNHIDAKVSALLCPGWAIKHKLKASAVDHITDDFLFAHCVPNICRRFPNDRRLCQMLGLAMLFAHCDHTLRDTLAECIVTRSAGGLQGVNIESNLVEHVPLHICTVNGNLCVNEVQVQGPGTGVGAAGGGPAMPGDGGTAGAGTDTCDRVVLQNILLNQHITNGSMALMQTQMDNGFASMKHCMQQHGATINGNVRRFGSAIQGGFTRQDPRQAADRRQAEAKNLQPGTRDGSTELTPNLQTLEDLWNEWKFGLGGRKAAEQFAPTERGGARAPR